MPFVEGEKENDETDFERFSKLTEPLYYNIQREGVVI